jgi:transmembrane sensor
MEKTLFIALIDKYLEGNATSAEQSLIEEYYKRLRDNKRIELNAEQELAIKEIMLASIRKEISKPTIRNIELYRRIAYLAVASLLILISVGLLFNKEEMKMAPLIVYDTEPVAEPDVEPGGNKAILTLGDGSKINLDDVKSGTIARQAGTNITKSDDGKLVYNMIQSGGLVYNQIETPKGGQYQITLPDGSKVWLNAASTLRYPAIFHGSERRIELTGEAYFEIAPDKSMPFRIETGNQMVEVLGTHFNISGYSDESAIKTTLIEGSVKVADLTTNRERFLRPGQVAVTTKSGMIRIEEANKEGAISWKEGFFIFNDMELEDIMRQLERWYNVEVDYSKIPEIRYNAHISRDLTLSKVLETLEITGNVKFKIEGRTIHIRTIENYP